MLWVVVSIKTVVEGGDVISAKEGGRVVGSDGLSASVGFEEEGDKVVVSAIVVDFWVVGNGVVFVSVVDLVVVVAGHVLTSWVVCSSGEVVV